MPEIISPIDGRPVHSFDLLTESAAFAKLGLAGATARAWRDVALKERVLTCLRMLEAYADRLDDNASEITHMMGKPIRQARSEFDGTTRERVSHLCEIAATALGPFVNEKAADFVRSQVASARAAGAKLLIGDDDFDVSDRSRCDLAPEILVDVDHSMTLMAEETFGPAIGIQPVSNDSQGIALINDSDFGLTASIWTADPERGSQIAEEAEAGTVFLNRCDYLDPGLACTGIKDSGFGSSLSTQGFLSVTRPKSFHFRYQQAGWPREVPCP